MYCPPNITLDEIWLNGGVSKCFMDTLISAVISSYLVIFGTVQLWIYHKESSREYSTLPINKLYKLQIFLSLFIPMINLFKYILQATVLYDKQIYGYMVRRFQ